MNRFTTCISFIGLSLFSLGQSPGGVTNNTLWLKANAGVTQLGTVSSWVSSGMAVNVVQGTAANQPAFRDGSGLPLPLALSNNMFNYCPYIFFDGTNDNLISTASSNFGDAATGMTEFGVFKGESGIAFLDWNGPNATMKCKIDGAQVITNGAGAMGTNNQYVVPNNTDRKIQHLAGRNTGLNPAGSAFCGYNHMLISGLGSNDNPAGMYYVDRTSVGCNANTATTGEYMRGSIAEIIMFNRILTPTEMLRVNSYLGIKYGFTLGGAGSVTNYLSSTGTVIWNSVAAYHNNVIGIGRDDASALRQQQSHSEDDSVRIYKGLLASTNGLNTSPFAADNSFVVIGANTGRLCATAPANSEIPPSGCVIYSRLEREWMVNRTAMAENFNFDVKLAGCAAPGSVNVSDLRLLIDDDGNFGNGGTQCYSNLDGTGVVFTYNNPVITVSGISTTHIPDNSVRYMTIASANMPTPLPVELLFFDADLRNDKTAVDLKWATETEINSAYFDVEKMDGNAMWTKIARKDAAGNSEIPLHYSAVDHHPVFGPNYYRLKQVDTDGSTDYSDTRVVVLEAEDLIVFPNPAAGTVMIAQHGISEKMIAVSDDKGRQVSLNITYMNHDTLQIDVSELAGGIYFLTVSGKKNTLTKLIVCH